MWKHLLIEVKWSLNTEKQIKTMAFIKRNGFHWKECTGGGGSSNKKVWIFLEKDSHREILIEPLAFNNKQWLFFSNGNVFLQRFFSIHSASFPEKSRFSSRSPSLADFFNFFILFSSTKFFFHKSAIIKCWCYWHFILSPLKCHVI